MGPLAYQAHVPSSSVMSEHTRASPELHHSHHQHQHRYHNQPQHQYGQLQRYAGHHYQPVPHRWDFDLSFSRQHHQQPRSHRSCTSPALSAGTTRGTRLQAISPSSFLACYGPGWAPSSGAAEGRGLTAAPAAAASISLTATETISPPITQYAGSPLQSFAAPASPGKVQYFLEPLIVNGQVETDGGRERGMARAPFSSYPSDKATSGGDIPPSRRRVCHSQCIWCVSES